MILTYQIYQLNCTVYKDNFEGFEGVQQSLGGVDDTNAINTLAQIAKNLMAGGVTIPGNMTIQGGLNGGGAIRGNFAEDQENGLKFPYHVWMKTARTDGGQDPYKMLFANDGKTIFRSQGGFQFRNEKDHVGVAMDPGGTLTANNVGFGGDNANGFRWGNEGGNGWACLRGLNGGDNSFCMHNNHGNGTRLHPGGAVTVKGRDILAEIDDLRNNAVRKDRQYYIDIGVRANGDGCCGNGKGLIIHGGDGAAAWHDKNVTTRFQFRQV